MINQKAKAAARSGNSEGDKSEEKKLTSRTGEKEKRVSSREQPTSFCYYFQLKNYLAAVPKLPKY